MKTYTSIITQKTKKFPKYHLKTKVAQKTNNWKKTLTI